MLNPNRFRSMLGFQQEALLALYFEQVKEGSGTQQAMLLYGRPAISFGHVVETRIILHELFGSDPQSLPSPSVDNATEIKTGRDQRHWSRCDALDFLDEINRGRVELLKAPCFLVLEVNVIHKC
jgi:hypothetical protein